MMQAIGNEGRQTIYEAPARFFFSTEMKLSRPGWAGVCFGLADGKGWALMANSALGEIHFMELKHNAVWLDRGMRRTDVDADTWIPLRGEYREGVLKIFFLNNPLDPDPWPVFEFPVTLTASNAACDPGRDAAEFRNTRVGELPAEEPRPAYTNPVMIGADPDVLLHEGRYYLYNRVPNDPNSAEDAYLYNGSDRAGMDTAGDKNAVFRVTSSEDLVHWTPYRTVFSRDKALEGAFCMSPNVVERNGWFYLFFAGGRFRGEESFHVYCASSRSPEGPFTLKSAEPVHRDIEEIGGMPFVDADGTVYLSMVRFDRGNHVWLQKIHLREGVAVADESRAVKLISPEEDYEVDEYGRIVEGAVFIPHNGYYYMIYADGHYMGHYGESCAVSKNIFGPYVRQRNNPILHHHFMADGTGDGIVIYNKDHSEMLLGYHRHVSLEHIEPRQTCIDRMKFVPDPKGGPDLLVVYGPTVTPQPMPFQK